MKEQLVNDDLARRFLLGQVSPQEKDEIAELAFADPDTFSRLESVEDDLIDEFLQDELSPAERENFETHFLAQPGRRKNLKLSRALQHYIGNEDIPVPIVVPDNRVSVLGLFMISRPVLRFSLVAAILIGPVFAIWMFVSLREAQQPPAYEARQEPAATPTPEMTSVPTAEPSPSAAPDDNKNRAPSPQKHETLPVYAVLMPLGPTRSGAQPLVLPSKGANVFVALPLFNKTTYNSYNATLQSDDETVLKSWSTLNERQLRPGRSLLVDIPIALLKPQALYRITVSGRSADGTLHEVDRYAFQVSNSP